MNRVKTVNKNEYKFQELQMAGFLRKLQIKKKSYVLSSRNKNKNYSQLNSIFTLGLILSSHSGYSVAVNKISRRKY